MSSKNTERKIFKGEKDLCGLLENLGSEVSLGYELVGRRVGTAKIKEKDLTSIEGTREGSWTGR